MNKYSYKILLLYHIHFVSHKNILDILDTQYPFQYLVNTKNVAPARWTLYDTPILAKETDLHCWTSMYNCCKNNNFNPRDLEFQNNQ